MIEKEFIEELENGYDADPEFANKELERMAVLCNEAAEHLKKYNEMLEFEESDPYRVLSKININEHTEEKNGLTYLSWAWAWDTLMSIYPDSYTEINRPETGLPYWTDGKTCWVDVSVTIEWNDGKWARTRSEVFPIMNYSNRSIPADKVTSFDINTALQRAWTKCIARHGLGFYIYAGQDLPNEEYEARRQAEEEAKKKLASDAEIAKVLSLYTEEEIAKMLKRLKKSNPSELTAEEAGKMIAKRDISLVTAKTESF